MATPVQNAPLRLFSWRRPTSVLRHAPRVLTVTVVLALLWAVVRPPLTLLAGMSRWQPAGSEHLYLMGVGIGIALDLLVYGFLLAFLLRGERWAQLSLVGFSLVQALYWGAQLAASSGGYAPVPGNYPSFASPPPVSRDAMYAASALLPAATAAVALLPGVWAWTRRDEPEPDVVD